MIELTSFGGFQLRVDGQVVSVKNRKTQALLVYLASSSELEHDRANLAALFWPDFAQAPAHNNLSKALSQIRSLFGNVPGDIEIVQATRHTVQMQRSEAWRLDASYFSQLVQQAQATADRDRCASFLAEAVTLYRGEFASGLSIDNSPEFEGWLMLHRENLMLMNRDSLQKLADYYLRSGDFEAARNAARQQLAVDSWHEEAHRQLMRALDGMGLRTDALAQYETCRTILRSELGLVPEESTRALYEQIRSGGKGTKLTDSPTPPALSDTMLPKRLFPLVGRRSELTTLGELIPDSKHRLITIVGTGGVGKTTLALEAARRAAANFRDGACFVPLEQLSARHTEDLQETLAATVGASLGISFSGPETINRQLHRELQGKELLLVVDNFEHLLDWSPALEASPGIVFLVGLLEQAAGVKLLVTSREQFGIPMEYVLALEGLAVPPEDVERREWSEYSSVRYFVEQGRRNQRDFRLTDENDTLIVSICRAVGGLPLAIELAARWVPHFTLTEIAEAIQENIDFLAAESPQLTARHQSLRATISYSWQMLTPGEKQMLESLSIISGRFSRQAALSITGGSLGSLVRLQGKSLLRQESPGQYSLHPILRQYLTERLAKQPADVKTDLHERFFAHYLELLAREGEGLDDERSGETIKEIAHHIDNIRNAWEMAYEASAFELLDKGLQPLYLYYRIKGLFREGKQLFAESSAAFQSILNQDSHNVKVRQLLGRAQLRQGRLAWLLGDTAQAIALFQSGLDHLKYLSSPSDLSRAHAYLGEAALRDGRIDDAEHLLDIALTRYQQEEDNTGIATTLAAQALLASQNQQYDEVDRLFEKSIRLSQQNANRRLEGRSLHDWGFILIQQGKFSEAAERFQGSLEIAHELELQMPIAFNESMLGRTDRHALNYSQSLKRLSSSLQVLEGSGYAFYTIRALNMLGEVLAIQGRADEARATLKKALDQLQVLLMADSDLFDYPTLDFFLATAYLFSKTERPALAGHYLKLVLARTQAEIDIRQRAHQLWRDVYNEDYREAGAAPGKQGDEGPLLEVLRSFSWEDARG